MHFFLVHFFFNAHFFWMSNDAWFRVKFYYTSAIHCRNKHINIRFGFSGCTMWILRVKLLRLPSLNLALLQGSSPFPWSAGSENFAEVGAEAGPASQRVKRAAGSLLCDCSVRGPVGAQRLVRTDGDFPVLGWTGLRGQSTSLRQGFEHFFQIGAVFSGGLEKRAVFTELLKNLCRTDGSLLRRQVHFVGADDGGDTGVLFGF